MSQTTRLVARGILAGLVVLLAVGVPTRAILCANLTVNPLLPWSAVITVIFLFFAWQYLNGWGWPSESSATRQKMLRARNLPAPVWVWSLIAGGLGCVTWGAVTLLIAHLSRLGPARLPDRLPVPSWTFACILIVSAIEEGVFQEVAFRGYIQTSFEECCEPATAMLLTAALFGVAQLARDFSVSACFIGFMAGLPLSLTAYLTGSIRPGIVLHIGAKLALVTIQIPGGVPLSGESEWAIYGICLAAIILALATVRAFRRLDDIVLRRAGISFTPDVIPQHSANT